MRKRQIVTAIMAALAVCLSIAFTGCDNKTQDTTPIVSQNVQTFIGIVTKVETPVSLESGPYISVALLMYDVLGDEEKASAEVTAAKQKLDGYKVTYDALKAADDERIAQEKEQRAAQKFLDAVNALPDEDKLRVSDREAVDAAYVLFAALKTETQSLNDVAIAYGKLSAAAAKVSALEEAARLLAVKQAAEAFITGVEELAAADEITLEHEASIKALQKSYERFDDDVKAYVRESDDSIMYNSVAEAKEALDGFAEECQVLRDEADIEAFLEKVDALGETDNITLDHRRDISDAESLYETMSDEAKAGDGVAEAYEALLAKRARYDELFAAAELLRIAEFIAAAERIGTNVDELDITWFYVLEAADNAYYALTAASQSLPEVKTAYERWQTAQRVYDSRGYKRITMVDPILQFSGDAPPHIILQYHDNMWNPLLDFYNVDSVAELDGKVTLMLNVYVDGEYVASGAFASDVYSTGIIAGNHIIQNSAVQSVMRALAAEHSEIVSGGNFSFTLSFEAVNNEFVASKESGRSAEHAYNW